MPLNVLLITADQWRADCLSAKGHPLVKTPDYWARWARMIVLTRPLLYCRGFKSDVQVA